MMEQIKKHQIFGLKYLEKTKAKDISGNNVFIFIDRRLLNGEPIATNEKTQGFNVVGIGLYGIPILEPYTDTESDTMWPPFSNRSV